MPCPRLAAPLLLALALAVGPASAQNAEVPPKPDLPGGLETPGTTPRPGPDFPSSLQPGDAFGEQVVLQERTIIYLQGQSKWDSALETLVDSFKSLDEYLTKHGIKPNGPAMTIYTQTDDSGFRFRAAVPIAETPKDAPKGDIAVGQAPSGKALKFVHRGSYDALDSSYEAITDYLDDKGLDAKDVFVEEYASGPLRADSDEMVINVYVPVK
jgi:effector-binding domain-containing protein